MITLDSLPGIAKTSLELLEAAGFYNLEALAKAGVDELTSELERANRILKISEHAPARSNVLNWIESARTLTGFSEIEVLDIVMPVNYELVPKVVAMLANAPSAIPLPARVLVKHQLAVGEIPPAILLNRYSGDLEVKIDERPSSISPKLSRPVSQNSNVKLSEGSPRIEIDTSRIKSIESLAGPAVKNPSAPMQDARVALIRGPRPETNVGKNPNSRRFIRGVLHSHPVSMTFGAIVTLLLFAAIPLAVISAALLLLSEQYPATFHWVPIWLLGFPISLPPLGLAYAIWGQSSSCRICGQKQFVPKNCLKNSKAHHIFGLGHIIPTCLHILLFRWFRCIYCATPVRLKE